jgi:hypothetical protein
MEPPMKPPAHAAVSPPTLAALVAALVPAFALTLAACNGSPAPAVDQAATPSATDSAPSSAATPAPASATPAPATAPPAPTTPPPMGVQLARFDGYGDVKLGMTAADARKAWQGELNGPADGTQGCYYVNPVSNPTPAYFAFMIEDGKFVRYDVGNDKELAPGGGKRGMSEAEITALYPGRVEASPHKYGDGKYLRVRDAASAGVLVFETDGAGKVTEWHVGLPPQVDYVEGCS